MKFQVEWTSDVERGVAIVEAPNALKAETTFLNESDAAGDLGRRCLRTTPIATRAASEDGANQ